MDGRHPVRVKQRGQKNIPCGVTKETGKESEQFFDDLPVKMKYKKLGNAGIEGGLFQVNLLTIFLLNAVEKTGSWRLSTENTEAGKFDDVIFEQPDGSVLLQAKHKKNERKKITCEDLLSTNSKKDEFGLPKYFFSYQQVKDKFRVRNVIICTNAYIEIKRGFVNEPCPLNEKSTLYFEGVGEIVYTFNPGIIPDLEKTVRIYHRENLQGKNISEEIISTENIKDFLNHLQFVAGYPSGENLDQIVQNMISHSKFSKYLDYKVAHNFLHTKMMEWFRQENGHYLNQKDARAIFCEMINNRYCQILEEHQIFFKNDNFTTDSNMKILHLISPGECLLSEIKIYRTLHTKNVLFVNLNDDVHVQNKLIDGFEHPCYTHLVLVCSKPSTEDVEEIYFKISAVLDKNNKKTVVLIAQAEDKIALHLKRLHVNVYKAIHENVSFTDLAEHTQMRFLEKTVVFQGHSVKLGKILAQLPGEDLNQLLSSELLSKIATNANIEVGPNVKPVGDHVCDYYISRSFNRHELNISEESMCLLDKSYGERIILISDCAGMGKSTVLTNMAVNIKKNYPNLWVVRINIISYMRTLREVHNKGLNCISITELLDSQQDTKFQNGFERGLFSVSGKVIMMIDGVDEISPDYTDIILNLLVNMKSEPNFVKIFVTTRPDACNVLERNLKVKSFTLEPFSERNQIDFLCKYWTNSLEFHGEDTRTRCCIYAQALVKKISRWINEDARNTLAGIPLQTKMLAEIFQEKMLFHDEPWEEWEGCREFLKSINDEPKLPRKIDLVELYLFFIHKKRDIFIHASNPSGSVVAEELLKEKFKEYYGYHCILAFEVFYGRDVCEISNLSYYMCNIHRSDLKETNLLKIGIIQEVNGEFGFVHRTFAEYFLAECFLKELKRELQVQVLQYDFKHILISKYSSGFRAFLDCFLQKELYSLPQSTFKAYRFINLADTSDTTERTVLHCLSREGCVGIIRFLFKCLDFDIEGKPPNRLRPKTRKRNLDVDIKDNLGRTPLQVAAECGHLDVIKLLLGRRANVNHKDNYGNTPLFEAVAVHHLDVAEFLVESGAKVNVKFRDTSRAVESSVNGTLLHLAAYKNNTDMVKLLVQKGAYVNGKNKDGCTALHIAARNGNIETVKLLLEKYANVNAQNVLGRTALHEAVRTGHFELCSLLINRGIDVSIKNIFGRTAFNEETGSWRMYKDWKANRYPEEVWCTYLSDKKL